MDGTEGIPKYFRLERVVHSVQLDSDRTYHPGDVHGMQFIGERECWTNPVFNSIT
jgi:hypothetical protein